MEIRCSRLSCGDEENRSRLCSRVSMKPLSADGRTTKPSTRSTVSAVSQSLWVSDQGRAALVRRRARAISDLSHCRARRWWVSLVLAPACAAPALAAASCPPFDIDRSLLGALRQDRHAPTEADRAVILRGGVIPGVPVGVWPPRGPA